MKNIKSQNGDTKLIPIYCEWCNGLPIAYRTLVVDEESEGKMISTPQYLCLKCSEKKEIDLNLCQGFKVK